MTDVLDAIQDACEPDVEFVERIVSRTPWGNKTEMVPKPLVQMAEVEETEEEKLVREASQKATEEIVQAVRDKNDAWWAKCLEPNDDGGYKHSAEEVAVDFNLTVNTRKRQMTASDVLKIRTRYGLPAVACHTKGKKFILGTGRKRQEYVVGANGAWRKVVNA